MNKDEILEGLMKAIMAEREGHSFYLMAANSTVDPKGREIFETLAAEELDHMKFLKGQYDSLLKTGKVDKSLKFGSRSSFAEASPIFSDTLKGRVKEAHFEMSALSIGIQLELDAIKFYKSQADLNEDPEIKKFYRDLTDWESGHYQALHQQHEELKQDYWSSGGFSPF